LLARLSASDPDQHPALEISIQIVGSGGALQLVPEQPLVPQFVCISSTFPQLSYQ
jgi:hypothetical protein